MKTIQAMGDMTAEQVAKKIGYSRGHLSRLMNEDADNEDSTQIEALLEEKFEELLQGVTFSRQKNFSPEQLYAMFIAVADKQTDILKSIESKVALETTQGQMKTNLDGVRRDVTKLVERQEFAVEEFRDLFLQLGARKKTASKGARKKDGQNGDNE